MAISSETSALTFTGNNSTVTAYALTFPFSGASEIIVTHITAAGVRNTLAVTTGYTLSGDTAAGSGQLVTVAAIPVTDSLLVERFTSAVQSLDSSSPAGSYPTSIEAQLDRTVRAVQDNKRIASRNFARSLRLPDGETAAEIPAATVRAGEVLYFNASTGAIETKTPDEILALSSGAPDGIGLPSGGTAGQYLRALGGGTGQWAALNQSEISGALSDIPAFRGTIGLSGRSAIINEHRLLWFWKACLDLATASSPSGKYLTVAGYGDSIAEETTGPLGPLYQALASRFGIGAILSGPFAAGLSIPTEGTFSVTLGGSASLVTNTWTYLPNGSYYSIPAGSTVTEAITAIGRSTGFKKLRCFYARRSGGGTLTFTVTQPGATIAAKNANTGTGTAGSIGYVDFEAADGLLENNKPSLVVSNTTATSHYLGSILYLDSGVVILTLSEGGCSLAQQNVYPRQNLIDFAAATGLALITHAFKEEDVDGSDLLSHVTNVTADLPTVSHLFLGQAPTSASDSNNTALTDILRAKCITDGLAFVDMYYALKSWTEVNALSWGGDGTHLSDAARRYLGDLIFTEALRNLPLLATRFAPVSREDIRDEFFTRPVVRHFGLYSFTSSTGGTSTNWTSSNVSGYNGVFANSGSGPVVDTWWGIQVLNRCRWRGNFDFRARWTQAENLPSGCHLGMAFGVTANAAQTLAEQGCWVQIHCGSAPFIRILLHDGTTLFTSPDFPLPIAPAIAKGYVPTAGDDPYHTFGMHYISNGASTSKEVVIWMGPGRPNNAATPAFRPYKVVHWKVTVGSGSSFPAGSTNLACFRVNAGSSLGSSSFPGAGLLEMAVDSGNDSLNYLPW